MDPGKESESYALATSQTRPSAAARLLLRSITLGRRGRRPERRLKDFIRTVCWSVVRRTTLRNARCVFGFHGADLAGPLDSVIPRLLTWNPRYHVFIRELARAVTSHFGPSSAVDIGANIGDTASLLVQGGIRRIAAIEGSGTLFRYLEENRRANAWNELHPIRAIVGCPNMEARFSMRTVEGNGTIIEDPAGEPSSSIEELLRSSPGFLSAALWKIDCGGCDARILNELLSLEPVRDAKPVICVEYVPPATEAGTEFWSVPAAKLVQIGYREFVAFDFASKRLGTGLTASMLDSSHFAETVRKIPQGHLDLVFIHERDRALFTKLNVPSRPAEEL